MRSDAHLRRVLFSYHSPCYTSAAISYSSNVVLYTPAGSCRHVRQTAATLAAAASGCYDGGTRGGYCTAPHHLSAAPMPIYSGACLSSPPIQALKCLVKFTVAHHLPHRRRDNVQILTQSPLKISRREARVQRKQGDDLQSNSRTRR